LEAIAELLKHINLDDGKFYNCFGEWLGSLYRCDILLLLAANRTLE